MKKVLAVDDDQNILESLYLILSDEGYTPMVENNGMKVEEQIEKNRPDLILLDIRLPGIPGNEVAKRIKSNKKTRNIPVILLSANYDGRLLSSLSGADAFIEKPFDISTLTTTVKQYIH